MNSTKIKNYVIAITVIFCIAILYFICGILFEVSGSSRDSESYFENLTEKIENVASKNELLSANYIRQLNNIFSETEKLSAITLKKDDMVFFAWPANSQFLKIDDKDNPYISTSSPVIKIFNKELSGQNFGSIKITAAVTSLLPKQIYKIGVRAFLIVLAGTLSIFIVLIYLSVFSKKKETASRNENTDKSYDEPEETASYDNNEIEEDAFDYLSVGNDADSDKTEDSEETIAADSETPTGLFSDKTGFGWESYLEPRLDAELVRAASSELDAALFVINIPGLERTDPAVKPVCDFLLNVFNYKDMLFEYGEYGYACLYVNMNIDQAMAISEGIYNEIKKILTANGKDNKICIGLSTRSLRLVPGSRLLKEAAEAADKASEQVSMPIVAFRVDHKKYKQYLAEARHL